MSKFKIIILFFLFAIFVNADSFSNPVFEDIKYIRGAKNKKICRNFIKNFRKDFFSKNEKSLILVLLSEFDSRNLKNYDLYLNLFSFSNSFSKNESNFLENWLQSLTNCVSFFSTTDLENILLTSNNVLKNSILSESKDFKWSFVGKFSSNKKDTLLFNFELDSLILSNEFNQIIIHNTKGSFDLRKNKFSGIGGVVDWSRLDFDVEKTTVHLSDYEIDLNKRMFHAENAKLKNSLYFNLESTGVFSDYLSRVEKGGDYPKFESYQDNFKIHFFNGFSCTASIRIERDFFYFDRKNKPLQFSFNNNYLNGMFFCNLLKLKEGSLSAENVSAKFYFNEDDSLFHPEMKFRYDDLTKNIYLKRYDDTYLGFKPISNSFHGLNIYSDFFRVNMESNIGSFVHFPDKINEKVLFESLDYYDDTRFSDLNIDRQNNLLDILIRFSNNFDIKNNISLKSFSNALKLNLSDAISIIKTLEIFGFVEYNSFDKIFDIKDRAFSFLDSKNRAQDFDSFQIESSCFLDDTVSQINFKNMEMNIFNVLDLKLTRQHEYNIQLKDKTITFFDDRSFSMNANLYFGNFFFSSHHIQFDYKDFALHFPKISKFNILNLKLSKKHQLIQEIFFKNGRIQLDSINNKSGFISDYDFPKFHLPKSNYAIYEDSKIKLILNSQTIPFIDELSIKNLFFQGKLTMENRFNNLHGDVSLDLLYGLSFSANVRNLNLYNQSNFSGDVLVSKNNFLLSGTIFNADFICSGNNILMNSRYLHSDSVEFSFLKDGKGPAIETFSTAIDYDSFESTIKLYSSKTSLVLYDDFQFSGTLVYNFSESNLFSKGELKAPLFNIYSDYFSFNKNSFMAGNSKLVMFKDGKNKFLGKGVSIEFSKKDNFLSIIKGDVNFYLPEIRADLSFEMATLDLNQKKIDFSAFRKEKESVVVFDNNFECFSEKFSYDLNIDKAYLFWAFPLYSNKYFITPENNFIVINNLGTFEPFIAKKIVKKKFGKNIILFNQLISFDKEMSSFSIQ